MNNEISLIALLFLGIFFGAIGKVAIEGLKNSIDKAKAVIKSNRLFKDREAAVAKMKAGGESHEWISINTTGGSTLVCKKTGWAPQQNGFISMELLNDYLAKVKAEEEYKAYRDSCVQKLASEQGMAVDKMEELVEAIFSIKKDFYLNKIKALQKEMKDRAAEVENGTKA